MIDVVVGVVLIVLGVAGATATARTLEGTPRASVLPFAVAPMGVCIGAGAALLRGWNLVGTAIAAAIVLPLVVVGRQLVRNRGRRREETW